MRILQIIDSLEAGGAERMAVSYANALAERIEFSGLVTTRKEGPLAQQLEANVSYLFLNKKGTLDLKAIARLRTYVKNNNIEIVQAHSTSFFLAFLLKLSCPNVKLVWHDHYGDSEFLSKRPVMALKIILPFFNGIISVNQNLKVWAEQSLKFEKVVYLPNFPTEEMESSEKTFLKGIEGKRIICLANLRPQKDHFLLLEVAKKIKESHPDWTFHLVGKDFEDAYSRKIKELILQYNLGKTVYLYGSKQDIKNILDQAVICILTSQSEGLPVALLEYGLHKKPVVVTNVGEIPSLVVNGSNGFLTEAHDEKLFYNALTKLMENKVLKTDLGNALHKTIFKNYSQTTVIEKYLNWLQNK